MSAVVETLKGLVDSGQTFTTADLQSLGFSRIGARRTIQIFRESGLCHVISWTKKPSDKNWHMVLIGGPGEDCPKPKVTPEQTRERLKRAYRKSYYKKKELLGDKWASKFRKTKYGLYSYRLDKILEEMEQGRCFTQKRAAELTGISNDWAGQLLRAARKAGKICIVDWIVTKTGHSAVYGWKHEGMKDMPRLGAKGKKKKTSAIKQMVKPWSFLYGAART